MENQPFTEADILTAATTRERLTQLGHSPRHPLGQNFLVDPNIVRKSLDLAQVSEGDAVVEIGSGLGTLTAGLLARGAEVWAVEFDETLFHFLNTALLPRAQGKLHLIRADAVDHPLAKLPPAAERGNRPFKIVANLPYAIATPWMEAVLRQPELPARMTLMLQRENAERFCAESGTKARGAISIYLENAYLREKGHPVSRQSFMPAPEVDSALLNLRLRDGDIRPFAEATRRLIRHFFTLRRKQLGAICKRLPEADALREWLDRDVGDVRLRPEALPLAAWRALDERIRAQAI